MSEAAADCCSSSASPHGDGLRCRSSLRLEDHRIASQRADRLPADLLLPPEQHCACLSLQLPASVSEPTAALSVRGAPTRATSRRTAPASFITAHRHNVTIGRATSLHTFQPLPGLSPRRLRRTRHGFGSCALSRASPLPIALSSAGRRHPRFTTSGRTRRGWRFSPSGAVAPRGISTAGAACLPEDAGAQHLCSLSDIPPVALGATHLQARRWLLKITGSPHRSRWWAKARLRSPLLPPTTLESPRPGVHLELDLPVTCASSA